jgi:transposase
VRQSERLVPRMETLFMAVWGMPPVSAAEIAALDHDYRFAASRLVRQRSHIVLLAYELGTQAEIAGVVRVSGQTVWRTLQLYRGGGRPALRRRVRASLHQGKVTLGWQKALAEAMRRGPPACGIARPTWTAPLLAQYVAETTGIAVSEVTVRRGLALLDYVCRRPTWTVRHKAEEQPDYLPKERASRLS